MGQSFRGDPLDHEALVFRGLQGDLEGHAVLVDQVQRDSFPVVEEEGVPAVVVLGIAVGSTWFCIWKYLLIRRERTRRLYAHLLY